MIPRILSHAPDGRAVSAAAEALHIREYDLFRLAYARWWGREPEPAWIEKVFVAYMFHQVVPPWVRHCARDVLDRNRAGTLDAEALGAARFRTVERPPSLAGPSLALTIVAAFFVYLTVAGSTLATDPARRMGCDAGPGLRFFETVASQIANRPLPECERGVPLR